MQVIDRPMTLVDQVIIALRKEIAEGRFAPASRLPAEQELARTLGCSRPVIREAVSQLKADGILITAKGVGAYVAANPAGSVFRLPRGEASAKDLAQLFELRFWMETAAAEAAALRRKTADLAKMRDALKRMDLHAGDYPAASKADVDFHAAIAASTQNAYLVAFSGFIEGQLLKAREMGWQNSATLADGPRPAQAEHQLLFQAIHAKDPERARQAAVAHLLASGRRMGLDVQKLENPRHAAIR